MLIDLFQLRTFVAVAEEQHLTRAAERLNISQSSASAHVRAVEHTLDMRLFVRANRNLELTAAGRLLLRRAKTLLAEACVFTSFARALRGQVAGQLVVGAGSEPGTGIGEIIGVLRQRHPGLNVDLRARASTGARRGLMSGELDIAMLLGKPMGAGFVHYQLTTEPYCVAGPVAWRDAIDAADWEQLSALPWVMSSGSTAYTAMLAGLFADKGLELNSVVRFDNAALGRALLRCGVGMMLMRADQAEQGRAQGYLAISPIGHTRIGVALTHQASRQGDPLIQAFVEAARGVWPAMARLEPDH